MKLLLERIVKEEAVNYALLILTMDKLTEDSRLTGNDVVRMDRELKEGIGKRIEDETNR